MKTKLAINFGDIIVQFDPQLLFQSLIIFIHIDEIHNALSYELCTRPALLFDRKGLMNAVNK